MEGPEGGVGGTRWDGWAGVRGPPRSMTFSHSVRKSCSRSCVCRRRSPPPPPPPPWPFICSACSPSASFTSSCSASLRKPAPAKPSPPPPPPPPVAGRCRARGCWLYGLCSICWLAAWRSGLPVDGRRLLAGHVLDCPKTWLACGEGVGWSSKEGDGGREGEVRARVWARVGEGKKAWCGAWPARLGGSRA